MAANDITQLMSNVQSYIYQPAMIQRTVLNFLSDVTNGNVNVVDPTNPVVFTLEAAAVNVAAFAAENAANTRKLYPLAAQTQDDLYLHMSDKDYIGRFATPSNIQISLAYSYTELLNKMVTDPDTGIKKLVIPRNTFFTVNGVIFSLQYPIEIRQMQHGGLQVVYDASTVSPLQTLETNVIPYNIRTDSGSVSWLWFTVEVFQFDIITNQSNVTSGSQLSMDITFSDQYYYTRVYAQNGDGTWTEILTTHTQQVYDNTDPTAVLTVNGQSVNVMIPQIYITTDRINNKIRADVYETKGSLNMDMGSYPSGSFVISYYAVDSNDKNEFTAPMETFSGELFFSESVTSEGTNGMTFDQLRQQVIYNSAGPVTPPITNANIDSSLAEIGYSLVTNVDSITNRLFRATKPMPEPTDVKVVTSSAGDSENISITPAGASIETLSFTIVDAAALDTVIDNGTSITITPNTVYKDVGGVIKFVPSDTIDQILSQPPDKRAYTVNSGSYYYSPFYYVVDTSNNQLDLRAYSLDAPTCITKVFDAENDTTLLQVTTDGYGLLRTPTGYKLRINTSSGDSFKALPDNQIFVQLAYIPVGEKDYAYMNGVQVAKDSSTGERTFDFDLSSNLNITALNNIQLSKFFMFNTEPRIVDSPLTNDFLILYATNSVMDTQWQTSSIDALLGRFLLPTTIYGITQETITLKFGDAMTNLWRSCRSVVDSVTYATYPADVPYVYSSTVYKTNPENGSIILGFDSSGKPIFEIEHNAGDPVLDPSGNQTYAHRKGDVVLDPSGNPVVANTRDMLRQCDMMLVEGVYWFATDQTSVDYKNNLLNSVVSWVVNDMPGMQEDLLEQTTIYFYPQSNMGQVNVVEQGGLKTTIAAGQSFMVTLTVPDYVYSNTDLRNKLTTSTVQTINTDLQSQTVAMSQIVEDLRAVYGSDVIDVLITGLGGSLNLSVLTVTDDGVFLSLRKKLLAQSDDTLIVTEDVSVNFVTLSKT